MIEDAFAKLKFDEDVMKFRIAAEQYWQNHPEVHHRWQKTNVVLSELDEFNLSEEIRMAISVALFSGAEMSAIVEELRSLHRHGTPMTPAEFSTHLVSQSKIKRALASNVKFVSQETIPDPDIAQSPVSNPKRKQRKE